MTMHSEIREGLRQAAKHPKKIDKLTDAQVEELTIRMAEQVNAALVKLRAVSEELVRILRFRELE
jgi:ACT domain-containing protein